jgi:hypothetical protein
MQAYLWRGALVSILLITLIGAVVVAVMEPNAGSIMGVVGAVGSLMGAFVTTGLDITATKKRQEQAAHPPAAEAAPIPAPGYAPAVQPRKTGINFGAIIKAATIGAFATGMFGLFTQAPTVGVICFCLEWTFYFVIGAAYAWSAHRDLPRGARLPAGSAFMGAALAAPLAAMVGIVGNSISAYILFGEFSGTAQDTAAALVLVICLSLLITPVLTGIGGAATAAMLRER